MLPTVAQAELHPPKRPKLTQQIQKAPKLTQQIRKALAKPPVTKRQARKPKPVARLAYSRSCSNGGGGSTIGCSSTPGGWQFLDNLNTVAARANAVCCGLNPFYLGISAMRPDIYQRNGRSTQTVALQWGLQYKSTAGVRWSNWHYAGVWTDSVFDTDYYSVIDASTGTAVSPDRLNFTTSTWYERYGGLPFNEAYRLQLRVVWYDSRYPGGVQADQTYVVPFGGPGTHWNQWLYYLPGVTSQGNPVAYIAP